VVPDGMLDEMSARMISPVLAGRVEQLAAAARGR
jgi:hypothetical protein